MRTGIKPHLQKYGIWTILQRMSASAHIRALSVFTHVRRHGVSISCAAHDQIQCHFVQLNIRPPLKQCFPRRFLNEEISEWQAERDFAR